MKYEKLHLDNVSKSVCGKRMLEHISLDVYKGELHMVIGDSGLANTTLASLITGQAVADSGKLYFNGKAYNNVSIRQAVLMGIRLMGSASCLVNDLSVKDNILLGKEPVTVGCFVLDKQAEKHLESLFSRLGLEIELSARATKLRFAERRLVEMVKLWYARCELIVLDNIGIERFTPEETAIFNRLIENIKDEGGSLLLLSDKLNDAAATANMFSYLKDGMIEYKSSTAPKGWLLEERKEVYSTVGNAYASGQCVLHVQNMCTSKLKDITFSVNEGEIVGITSTEESDCLEMAHALCGKGLLTILGREAHRYIIPGFEMSDIVTLPLLSKVSSSSFLINKKAQQILTEKCLKAADVPQELLENLPENLQSHEIIRILLARCEWIKPKVIVCHEITYGMTHNQKQSIYKIIKEMAAKGHAFILISVKKEDVLPTAGVTLEVR